MRDVHGGTAAVAGRQWLFISLYGRGAARQRQLISFGRRGAAAVEFLESVRLFSSKKLLIIEILRSFLLYQHIHFI